MVPLGTARSPPSLAPCSLIKSVNFTDAFGRQLMADPDRLPNASPQSVSETEARFILDLVQTKVRRFLGPRRRPDDCTTDFQDLVQECVAAVLKVLNRFDGDRGSLAAFIATVADNVLRDYGRRVTAAKRNPGRDPRADRALHEISPDDTTNDRAKSPFQEQHRDLTIDLAEALGQLPQPLREVADDSKLHSAAEVADRHGLHTGTVYRRLEAVRRTWDDRSLRDYLNW